MKSQVPEISATKIDGLKKFYGIDRPEALAYFAVHEEADKAHRAAWRGWLEDHADGYERRDRGDRQGCAECSLGSARRRLLQEARAR